MKFEFNEKDCKDFGLIVKHGNKDNIVVFYDKITDASGYIIELFRVNFALSGEGFLQAANIQSEKVLKRTYQGHEEKENTFVDVDGPAYVGNELVAVRRWDETDYYRTTVKFSKVERYSFDMVKPICSISIDRNQYFANIDFLPYGNYLLVLKAENRNGEIIAATIPYYFVVSIDDTNKRLKDIESGIRACAPNVVHI